MRGRRPDVGYGTSTVLISRLLAAHAADHGIDLFATVSTGNPHAGSPAQTAADPGPGSPPAKS